MNLYQRINEIRKEINYVQKDKNVSTGASGGYKAVSHDAVTGMVREHMVKHGVVSYPVLVDSLMNPKEVDAQMVQSKQNRYEATYDFFFVNIDEPSEFITIRIQAHAMDNADKAPGKALSYAKKYAILKLFEIETGEDDESRYQEKETFNLEFHLKLLKDAKTIKELEAAYLEAKKQSTAANDVIAFKAIGVLTTSLKTALLESAQNA